MVKFDSLEAALIGKIIPEEIRAGLVLLDIEYSDFGGKVSVGQLVVHRELANEVVEIFREILAAHFPIEKMLPVSVYDWCDDASMADNNTSGFNYRLIVGKTTLSKHAFGLAIDINPVQNPYVKGDLILPPRAAYNPSTRGTLLPDGPVVAAFEKRGWKWGGRWTTLQDWHHFEKPAG